MDITNKSTKSDIIDEACVIISDQDQKIESYREERKVMVFIISFLCIVNLIF